MCQETLKLLYSLLENGKCLVRGQVVSSRGFPGATTMVEVKTFSVKAPETEYQCW